MVAPRIAVLTAPAPDKGGWDVDAWLDQVTGPNCERYDSGLADDVAADRGADDEPGG